MSIVDAEVTQVRTYPPARPAQLRCAVVRPQTESAWRISPVRQIKPEPGNFRQGDLVSG